MEREEDRDPAEQQEVRGGAPPESLQCASPEAWAGGLDSSASEVISS